MAVAVAAAVMAVVLFATYRGLERADQRLRQILGTTHS